MTSPTPHQPRPRGGDADIGDAPGDRLPPPPVHRERRRRQVGWRSTDVLRASALVIAMYVVLRLLWFANPLFLTAFLGVLFGLAMAAGVDWLQAVTRRWFAMPRGLAAALILVTTLGLLGGFGAWVAPTLRGQGVELRQRLPEAVDRVQAWVDARRAGFFGVLMGAETQARVDSAQATRAADVPRQPPLPGAAPLASDSGKASPALPNGEQPVTVRERLSSQLSKATKYFFPFLTSTLSALAGVVLVIFLSVYIGSEPGLYHAGLMHLFPHRARARAGEVLSAMAVVLRRWLFTQLIAMVVIGAVSSVALLLLHVRAPFALGILAGLLEFIPTVGPIISGVPAVAMGFLDSPHKALLVAIVYVVLHFAESHLLIPLLMKGGIDLPPVVTILSQALMALLFGFLGLLVAVPLVAAAIVPLKMLYVEGVIGDEVGVAGRAVDDDDDDDSG